jgi:hypothetical protein
MRFLALMAAVCELGFGSQAAGAADISRIYLTGTITQETRSGDPVQIGVGDVLTVRAEFDPLTAIAWGDTGYKVVGFKSNGEFSITLNGYRWLPRDDLLDGPEIYRDDEGGTPGWSGLPVIIFKGGKVAGLASWLSPAKGPTPDLLLGSGQPSGTRTRCYEDFSQVCTYFSTLYLKDQFQIARYNLYGNSYTGGDFNGVWNFADSQAPVPEPQTWAMMILGMGLAGAVARSKRSLTHRLGQTAEIRRVPFAAASTRQYDIAAEVSPSASMAGRSLKIEAAN